MNGFVPQLAQSRDFQRINEVDWKRYWESGFAITGWLDDRVAAFGGIVEIHKGIGECWLMLSNEVSHCEMFYLVRGIRRLLDSEMKTAYHRTQMYVETSFQPGVRLAKMLGMRQEGLLEDYPLKGVDSFLFART